MSRKIRILAQPDQNSMGARVVVGVHTRENPSSPSRELATIRGEKKSIKNSLNYNTTLIINRYSCVFPGDVDLRYIEFFNVGQLGHTSEDDPRYAISFVNAGDYNI